MDDGDYIFRVNGDVRADEKGILLYNVFRTITFILCYSVSP